MDQDAKRQLENQLVTKGLPFATSGDLVQAMANLVSAWPGDKHVYMEDLINQCDADKRYEMYHAIAPKLKFTALPLETYESRIAIRAGRMVTQKRMRVEGQERKPIEVQGEKFEEVDEAEATGAVATLTCKCGKKEYFLSNTPVGAMTLARQKGWVRNELNREVCPACVKKSKKAKRLSKPGCFQMVGI